MPSLDSYGLTPLFYPCSTYPTGQLRFLTRRISVPDPSWHPGYHVRVGIRQVSPVTQVRTKYSATRMQKTAHKTSPQKYRQIVLEIVIREIILRPYFYSGTFFKFFATVNESQNIVSLDLFKDFFLQTFVFCLDYWQS